MKEQVIFAPRYALFFDNHTQREIYDFASRFDAPAFAEQVKRCGADLLTFHARCNRGFAYYDTQIGTRHPGMKEDIFGAVARECEKQAIRLAAYFNGGLSGIEAVQHPDWVLVTPPGSDAPPKNSPDPFGIRMCLNSPYRRHLMAMMREVLEKYPHVSGFFIDCVHNTPCACPRCRKVMAERGITDFQRMADLSVAEFCEEAGALVRELLPEGSLFFNSNNVFRFAGRNDTFLDCECLPTAGWGYECLPTLAHWVPELRPGGTVLNMTGRFYDWGDFGGVRTVPSLEYDLFYGLMHGMRPEIGGHFHPRGELDLPVFDIIAATYAKLRSFETYFSAAPRRNEAALLLSSEEELKDPRVPVSSAVRMLEELRVPFSVITDENRSLETFKAVILPENRCFPEHLIRRLENFDGAVIGCGTSAAERLGEYFGIRREGPAMEPAYYDAPGMPLSIYAGADQLQVLPGAVGRGALVKPYCSPGFAGGMAICYTPPEKATEFPFSVRRGNRIFCAGHIFSGYTARAAVHLRALLGRLLGELLPQPQFKGENLYSFTRTALAEEPGRRVIYLLNFVPEARGKAFAVEDEIELSSAKVSLRLDGFKVEKVFCGPERREVPFTLEENYCSIDVPPFRGFTALELAGTQTGGE